MTRPETTAAIRTPRSRIRNFLTERWPDLRDDEDLFESGLVNSLFAMQLVLFVEQEFAIEIGNEDLERTNFRSVDSITELVERHVG